MGSVRINGGSTDYIYYVPDPSGNVTVCWWQRMLVDTNTFTCFAWLGNFINTYAIYVGTDGSGTLLQIWQEAAQRGSSGTNLVVGLWYHCAIVYNTVGSSAFTLYVNGRIDITGTLGTTGVTSGRITFGNDQYNEGYNGLITSVKVWNAKLLRHEIVREMWSKEPVRRRDLWQWSPLPAHGYLADRSGLGRGPYIINGTITTDPTSAPDFEWYDPRFAAYSDVLQQYPRKHRRAPSAMAGDEGALWYQLVEMA